jgi:cold shock CspA family protein
MKLPLQVTFRNTPVSRAAEKWIRDEVENLETFYSRLMGCRVVIEVPHAHHRKGAPYHVRIDLTVPGGELVVNHEPTISKRAQQRGEAKLRKELELSARHRDLHLAIDDAFRAASRRLADYARKQDGRVKTHEPSTEARVSRLRADEGYGFLQASDGREIYFNKNSVLNRGFKRMAVGTRVTFSEESGEKGPQASTVRIAARSGLRGARKQAV